MTPKKTSTISHPVAIIGMGCIFPESRNLKEYWHLLFNGIDAVQPIPEDSHWQLKDYFDSDPARPDHTYCTRGGFIPKIAFNPLSYGIPPNNIEATDTSQLLGLEVARMALADAGYPSGHPDLEQKKVNVILGVTGTQELVIPLGSRLGHPLWKKAMEETGIDKDKTCEVLERLDRSYVRWQENSFPGLLGNVVAGRIANRLNLSGTNAVSDAACASSLSAIHTAVMELQSGRCDMSITGGVDTLNDIFMHMCFSKTGVLSHSSDAKPFSKDADGTVLGEGIGMLVLKRLADAEKDKDRIYAVIKGVGTASDGRTSAVYAPEAKGQIKALKEAYERAGVNPASIGLIEAHGTGTRVGDKVEFTALKTLFGPSATPNSTAIGSVKSMIGHTKAAAGAAGMIKTALALHHKVIPPTLKADIPDPDLDINASAFYLNNSAKPWVFDTDKSHPRRSGVSAFGFGGSNFHVVLEEYQSEKNHVSWDGAVQIIALSAGDKEALSLRLRDLQKQMATFDSQDQAEYTQAIAWQAHESRQNFSSQDRFRLLILVTKEDDFARLMEEAKNTIEQDTDAGKPALKGPVFFGTDRPKGKLGFVFPGQGSQYTGMAKDIMAIFPEAMEALALGQSCLAGQARKTEDEKERTAPDLSRFIYPLPSHLIEKKEAEAALRQTDIAQPAIGSVSLAMTRILKGFNIAPDYTCGHSFGELSALYAAGWMDKTNFLSLSAARGRYMADAGKKGGDPGSMLAVQAPIEKIRSLIKDHDLDLVLANINSPLQGVLSGSTEEIDRAYGLCRKQKMRGIKLPVAAAFHSRLVENAARPFNTAVAEIPITPTQVQVVSNTTGRAYPGDEKEIKEILGHQLMHPVNFTENIQFMYDQGVSTFLEIGPKSVLTGLIRSILKDSPAIACALDGSGGKNKGMYDLGLALCTIAALGYPVDLGPWEEPAKAPEPKKMKLMLSGANQKSKREQLPPSRPAAAKVNLDTAPAPGSGIPAVQAAPEPPKPEFGSIPHSDNLKGIEHPSTQGRPMTLSPQSDTPSKERHPGLVPGSMDMLQRGLEAMQQLQAQTARAHEKFLETQAQAGRTLAGILEQSRSGALDAPGSGIPAVQPPPAPMAAPAPVAAPPVQPAPRAEYQNQEPVSEPPQAPVPETVPPQASEASAPLPSGNGIQKILFEIVSRLTGFPVEMLEPQMDIESDLGIDSIKKVEIISELEKAMDQGHALTPDHLSAVRTLEDICRAAGENGQKEDSRPEPEAAPQGNGAGTDRVFATLVEIISQLTGFPKEMLEPEMSLESDLGIDSIKRVEILSKLEQELADLPAISPDEMAGLKTIKDITQYLSPHGDRSEKPKELNEGSLKTSKKKTSHEDLNLENPVSPEAAPQPELLRQEIGLKTYPTNQIRFYNGTRIQIPSDRTVYLTRDASGIAQCFQEEFTKLGIQARLIDMGPEPLPDLEDAAGLVIVPDAFASPDDKTAQAFLSAAFSLTRQNSGHLIRSGEEQAGFFTTLSFLGGGFGFGGPISEDGAGIESTPSPVYGGLAGLSKTAALEWPTVLCRALDLPADPEKAKENAEAAVALMMTHGEVEMGLDGDLCAIPTLESTPLAPGHPGALDLNTEDVVVITGGAKGVTAECALALAESCSPRIVLLGRSPAPGPEPEWIRGIDDPGEMKKAILAHEFKGKKATPMEIDRHFQSICSNRSILENISRIQAKAAQVQYHCADIRDKAAVAEVFNEIQADLGPVTALIHGAGVLQDKRIADKTPEQFNIVFNTKVEGLDALMAATDPGALKYLVFFSSIAARMGNPGQCDYAMANEVLNKTGQAMARALPRCRVVSINWGPWDGGMVNAALKREFTRRGVSLIPLGPGAAQLVKEMGNPDRSCVEVVIGGSMNPEPPKKEPVLNRALTQTLGSSASPIINDHRINREPVVPFALMADLMAAGAEKNNPGLIFAGMDRMRLLKGLRPGNADTPVQVDIAKCKAKEGLLTAPATLTSGESGECRHAKARMILADTLPEPPVLSRAAFMDLKPYGMTAAQAYENILFHGQGLQSILKIKGISPKGIEVVSRPAPAISDWYDTPHTKEWTLDPLMLDTAFQAAILWTHHTREQVCLPGYFANLRVYRSYPARQGNIRILFTVNHETRHKIQGYFTFLDETDTVIASIMGFEAYTDPDLIHKFKPAPLFDRSRILAFAQGKPSEAFGAPYEIFDQDREIARLPRPPYFFMDAVVSADHAPWEMAPGGWIETSYTIPEAEWYFRANRTATLPFCILLEIALQPCGWLAAYAGSALKSQNRLHFRNLGGEASLVENLDRNCGTLNVKARMTDVSQAGGMIIQEFDMEVWNRGQLVYQGNTNFGFFTRQALSNQVGIRDSRFYTALKTDKPVVTFTDDAPINPSDTASSPDRGMPAKALRMIDAIDHLDLEGGLYGKGCVQAVKKVDETEWFFNAHFYQDPVCPGSLGVESFLQMLRFFLLEKYEINPDTHAPEMTIGHGHRWIYRGQVVPENKLVTIQAHIKETGQNNGHYTIVADGALVVDGICIYEMEDFGLTFAPAQTRGSHQVGQIKTEKTGL